MGDLEIFTYSFSCRSCRAIGFGLDPLQARLNAILAALGRGCMGRSLPC